MNVASLGLCRELYEVSGWSDTIENFRESAHLTKDRVPAYDLGYLMRKLPHKLEGTYLDLGVAENGEEWWAAYEHEWPYERSTYDHEQKAATPEDAACKLAIELFKQGILTKEAA
jgi:hypothetical protein